ncbi:MAG: M20 family metallopeptidase [Microlunatus sp.]|nr:M20 family metallopeptidase [Microlunatus sp.]MDN5769824.1 M20 family metallopeptidase [Microlunatus sp.]
MTVRDPSDPPRLGHSGEELMRAATAELGGEPPTWPSHYEGVSAQILAEADTTAQGLTSALVGLSHQLYAEPELGFEEVRSVAKVAELLRGQGYEATVGVYGLDTALEARVSGGDGPTVAIMAEYDALPDIGHGCGHNVICAAGVGAFLTAAPLVQRLGGTLVLLGTPAEENGTGKALMMTAGALAGVDAAMMVHPFAGESFTSSSYLGLREVAAHYRGITAHAAATPFLGINALDAAVLGYTGVQSLRQHLLPQERVHGVFIDNPERPNVVPERAGLCYYLRSPTMTGLSELSGRMQQIFRGAALATGAQLEVNWDLSPPCLPMRSNHVLADRFAGHFTRCGHTIYGRAPDSAGSGSTDMGNVSQVVPSIHPMIAIAPAGLSLHTAEFAQYATSAKADEMMLASARSLAATALDLVADPSMLTDVRTEFDQHGGPVDVEGALRVE